MLYHVSCVDLWPLKSAKGPLFQTIKITVIDVDQLLEPTGVPTPPNDIFAGYSVDSGLVATLLRHTLCSCDWFYV